MWLLLPIVIITALFFAAIAIRQIWLSTALLSAAKSLQGRGDSHAAERVLQAIIQRPSFMFVNAKAPAQFMLAGIQLEQGRGSDAAQTCRALLDGRLKKEFRTLVRLRLADGLELAGDVDEARREREAAGLLTGDDAVGRMARAQSAMTEGQFAEAARELDEAIKSLPKRETKVRSVLMARSAHAHLEAGNIEKATRMTGEAVAMSPDSRTAVTSYGEQAVIFGLAGKLKEAEASVTKAIEFARECHESEQESVLTAVYADIVRRQGRVDEAYLLCRRAADLTIKNRRTARMAEVESLRSLERFEEAARVLNEAERYSGGMTPQLQRRSDSFIFLGKALVECERGNPKTAHESLQRLTSDMPNDPRLITMQAAIYAWIAALEGRSEDAIKGVDVLWRAIQNEPLPPAVLSSTQYRLARILLLAGEAKRALECLTVALDGTPDPIDVPGNFYSQGEAHAALGDIQAARECWQRAAASEFGAPFVRKATQRLAETTDVNPTHHSDPAGPVANCPSVLV